MANYADRLKGLRDAWKNDKAESGIAKLPEGKYQFFVKRAYLNESKASFNKGNIQISLDLEVATGPMKGRKYTVNYDLEAKADIKKGFPSGISRFKGLLETLEIDMPKSFEERDLKKTCEDLLNIVVEGACVHNKKGYANVYINGLVSAAAESEDDEAEAEEPEEEPETEAEEPESDDDEEEPPAKKPAAKPAKKAEEPDDDDDDDDDDDWANEFDDDEKPAKKK